LAGNVTATIRRQSPRPFRYASKGGLVSLGRYKGVAKVLRVRLTGFPAWVLHRTYHVAMVPTLNRKVRIVADWTVALFFSRDVVQLGSLRSPRQAFLAAAATDDLDAGTPSTSGG
jgi:NADH dehydrogenase